MEKASADQEKLQEMVNLQRAQYEKIKKVEEASTKFEGLPKVVESQANDIKELKSFVETIQAHVFRILSGKGKLTKSWPFYFKTETTKIS